MFTFTEARSSLIACGPPATCWELFMRACSSCRHLSSLSSSNLSHKLRRRFWPTASLDMYAGSEASTYRDVSESPSEPAAQTKHQQRNSIPLTECAPPAACRQLCGRSSSSCVHLSSLSSSNLSHRLHSRFWPMASVDMYAGSEVSLYRHASKNLSEAAAQNKCQQLCALCIGRTAAAAGTCCC